MIHATGLLSTGGNLNHLLSVAVSHYKRIEGTDRDPEAVHTRLKTLALLTSCAAQVRDHIRRIKGRG